MGWIGQSPWRRSARERVLAGCQFWRQYTRNEAAQLVVVPVLNHSAASVSPGRPEAPDHGMPQAIHSPSCCRSASVGSAPSGGIELLVASGPDAAVSST